MTLCKYFSLTALPLSLAAFVSLNAMADVYGKRVTYFCEEAPEFRVPGNNVRIAVDTPEIQGDEDYPDSLALVEIGSGPANAFHPGKLIPAQICVVSPSIGVDKAGIQLVCPVNTSGTLPIFNIRGADGGLVETSIQIKGSQTPVVSTSGGRVCTVVAREAISSDQALVRQK